MRKNTGIGLRQVHYKDFLDNLPQIDWVEVHSENFFAHGGANLATLEQIRKNYDISFHGVGLSIGSSDKISKTHLKNLKFLVNEFDPFLVSEHLSWGSVNNLYLNDLLPLPYNSESFNLISEKIDLIQQYLGREILIENASTYLKFNESESDFDEASFLNNLAAKTDCGILLDVNNLYVNSYNHQIDPIKYLDQLNTKYIKEIHLAGHTILEGKNILIDTHDNYVCKEVWQLYETTIKKHGIKPTLLEWDDDLPSLNQLILEAKKSEIIIKNIYSEILC